MFRLTARDTSLSDRYSDLYSPSHIQTRDSISRENNQLIFQESDSSLQFPVQPDFSVPVITEDNKNNLKASSSTKSHTRKCAQKVYNSFFHSLMTPIPRKSSQQKSFSPLSEAKTVLIHPETLKDIVTSIKELLNCPMDLKVTIYIPPMYTTRKRWPLSQELELLHLYKQYNANWNLISKSLVCVW